MTILTDFLGGEANGFAGYNMRNTTDWKFKGSGTNGFNALPGSSRSYSGYFDDDIGGSGSWWSTTESGPTFAWHIFLSNLDGAVYRASCCGKGDGRSVRCLRD